MKVIYHAIPGLVEFIPKKFLDERGYFFESYNQVDFIANMGSLYEGPFMQDNQSFSKKGVIRGLHCQREPYAQGKMVRVVSGKVVDVIVDIRKESPTYLKHCKIILDSESNNIAYVPKGCLHGFAALEDSVFSYKCTNVYHKESELGYRWSDPTFKIDWGVENPTISKRDRELPLFLACP